MNFNFSETNMVVSPVSRSPKTKSNINYCEQKHRYEAGERLMWDDAKGNPTKTTGGGAFGFVHNGKRVEIHGVIEVCRTTDRLPSWSVNIGKTDRNVLVLTPLLCVIEWDEWISLGGVMKVQGTSRVVGAHSQMADCLAGKIGNYTYCVETGEVFM